MKTNLLRILGLLPIVSLLMVGCTEEETTEPDYSKVHLIKTEVLGNNSDSFTHTFGYEYNNDGKIVKKTWDRPEANTDIFEYQYNSSAILIIHSSNDFIIDTTVLELNSQGLVACEYKKHDDKMTRYKYDGQGYCISSRYYKIGADTSDIVQEIETAKFTYLNGDLLLEDRIYNGTTSGQIQNYYYKDKVNTLGHVNRGQAFYGKSSKHLIKLGDVTDEFDTEGRLIKRVEAETYRTFEFY
jgi:hypothetical protein